MDNTGFPMNKVFVKDGTEEMIFNETIYTFTKNNFPELYKVL
jgi:hypothetical protein